MEASTLKAEIIKAYGNVFQYEVGDTLEELIINGATFAEIEHWLDYDVDSVDSDIIVRTLEDGRVETAHGDFFVWVDQSYSNADTGHNRVNDGYWQAA